MKDVIVIVIVVLEENYRDRVCEKGRNTLRNAVDAGQTQNFAFGTFELGLAG